MYQNPVVYSCFMVTSEALASLIGFFKVLVSRMPTGRLREAEGIVTAFGNTPYSFLNTCILETPPSRPAFARAIRLRRECPYPAAITFQEEAAPSDWESLAAEHGLVPYTTLTWMTAEQLLPPRRSAPPLHFRRVADILTATDLVLINDAAYGIGLRDSEAIPNLNFWQPDTVAFVGYIGERAVTSAAAFSIQGVIYVGFVATLPEFAGQGYAETVMRHTITEAASLTNSQRITLHASDAGQPLYRSMGFTPGPRFRMLI